MATLLRTNADHHAACGVLCYEKGRHVSDGIHSVHVMMLPLYGPFRCFTHDHMTIAKRDKFIAIISLVALRGQIMTVKVHSGLCMKYSRWVIYVHIDCAQECQFKSRTHVHVHVAVELAGRMFYNDGGLIGQRSRTFVAWTLGMPDVELMTLQSEGESKEAMQMYIDWLMT